MCIPPVWAFVISVPGYKVVILKLKSLEPISLEFCISSNKIINVMCLNRISLGFYVFYFTFSKCVFAIIITDCKIWIHIKTTQFK
jgi:hypothetical protein